METPNVQPVLKSGAALMECVRYGRKQRKLFRQQMREYMDLLLDRARQHD